MNKVLGIIAEYNPFHNGHLYHLEESKKATNCNYSVAVISGNFTQRGIPSIVDKWQKTKMALSSGVDLVIELPTLYAISSAENFADGAVKILDSLGIVDYISFGAETNDLNILNKISDVLYTESEKFKTILSKELDKGLSFPKARENALIKYLNDDEINSEILSSSNNILGLEYLKALKKHKSNIKPFALSRFKVNHNDSNISNNLASSSTIRKFIKDKDFETIKKLVPETSYSILMENIKKGDIVTELKVFVH